MSAYGHCAETLMLGTRPQSMHRTPHRLRAVPDPPTNDPAPDSSNALSADDARDLEELVDDIQRLSELRDELWTEAIPKFIDQLVKKGSSADDAAALVAEAAMDADTFGAGGFREASNIIDAYQDFKRSQT
jgi:hypothetical protein